MLEIEDIYYNKTTRYTSKWSNYFELYEQYFHKFIGENPVVLEIGVDNGGSMEMWHHYFGSGCSIVGIDNRPKLTSVDLPDTEIIYGEQGDPRFWDNFVAASPNLDIVVDDGSHYSNHQILTFEKLFPHMNEGGVYFVEDTHSSYMDTFYGGLKQRHTFIEYCKNIIDILHADHYVSDQTIHPWMRQYIKGIHFYDSVVIIEKELRPKNHVTYSHREIAI